jgi:uncharacterized membrane protein
MSDLERELQALKARVTRLETLLKPVAPAPTAPHVEAVPVARPAMPLKAATRTREEDAESPFFEPQRDPGELTVTQVMGWAGATLLVLAAAYLIRLVYDTGWLTPARQIALAFLGGVALIAAGLRLGRSERVGRDYASLLPAGGLVVFYLAGTRCSSLQRFARSVAGASF